MNFILNSTINVLGSFYVGPVYNHAKAFLTTKPNQSFKDITKDLIFSKLVIPFIASKVNSMSCVEKTIAESGRLIAAASGKAIQWWFSRSINNLIHNELKMNDSCVIPDSSEQTLHSAIMEVLNPLIKTNNDQDLKLIIAEIGKQVISQIIQTKASYLIAGRFFNKEIPTIMEIAYPTFLLQVLKSAES